MIYDISPLIDEKLAVWPEDTPFTREVLQKLSRGDSTTLSTMHTTVHLGAHADAPSHYGADAPTIDRQSLEPYLGPCQVLRVSAAEGEPLPPELLPDELLAERLLLATGSNPDRTRFNREFNYCSTGLVDALQLRGARLLGIDTPSIDAYDSRTLPAHRRCLAHGMAILEGLVLEEVPEGLYELIALPLRLGGFDGSPVRAILRS